MGANVFSSGEALKFGWQATKEKFWFFAAIFVVVFIISIILSVAVNAAEPGSAANMLVSLITTIFNMIVSIGLVTITLAVCNNKPTDFFDLFSNANLIIKYFVASIVYGIIVFLGCLLLIIPGIILAIRLQFFTYLIVDQNMGPIKALKKSMQITKGSTFSLLVFGVLISLVNTAGVLCLGIGLFAAVPTTLIAIAFVYKKLLSQTEDIVTVTENAI